MIEQTLVVKSNLTASFPFHGNPSLSWNCRIVDSNLGTDGDPKVNFVRNGFVDMTFLPRHLGSTIKVIFYEDHEKASSERFETVSNIASSVPKWGLGLLSKIAYFSKKMAAATLILIFLSTTFAVVNYYFDISGFLDEYQKYNAANGARVLERTVEKIINTIDDPFYDAEGVKAIEEEMNVSYESMFTRVDEDLYLMKNVFVDEDDNAVLMTYGDAEDRCDDLSGYILPFELLQEILPIKTHLTVRQWSNNPEWTGTARGLFSDDYVIHLKDGKLIEGTYKKDGLIYGDAEDVKISARCGVLRATFIEEE